MMKIGIGTIKIFMRQYRKFSIVIMLQIVCLAVFMVTSLRKATTYELDCDSLIVKDPAVVADDSGTFSITRDEEPFARWIISSDKLNMPHGVYELEVNYYSMLNDLDNGGGNCEDATGTIQLVSENNASGFQYKDISLTDGRNSTTDRIWVRSITGIDDMEVKVCFFGQGDLLLTRIVIKELLAWRVVCIIGWLLAFAIMDALYIYFFTRNSYKDKQVVFGLLVTIVFSSLPLLTDFLFGGHDLDFHIARIWALAEGIKNGHWIVPIQTELNNEYGYASPLFYGQLFLYIPAILYVLAAPLQVCYQVYAFFVNAATCLICYYCIKGLLKDKNLAVLGAFLYTLSAYRIINLYVRAAVGEYTAMVFFPLVLYGFAKVYMEEEKNLRGGVLAIVVGLSGVIHSHLISCEQSAFFIILLCIIYIRKTLQPKRLLALVSAALLTVVVNLAFIIPFLQSMQMDIEIKNRIDRIQNSGIYLMQALGIFMTSGGGDRAGTMYAEMPITIGFSLIVGLGIFMLCCAKKYDWGIKGNKYLQAGTVCSGFTIMCIIFSTRFFPWDNIKDISEGLSKVFTMVQFPWRYLSIGTVTCVIAAVIGVKLLSACKGAVYGKIAAGIMIGCTLLNIGHFFVEYGNSVPPVYVYGIVKYDAAYTGGGEYLPTGTKTLEMNWRRVVTDETFVTVDQYNYTDGITTFLCKNVSDEEQTVEIPLLNYANYHAYALNNHEAELEIRNGENNFVNIVIPPGYEGTVQVLYKIPLLWKLSYIISAIAAISIIINVLYNAGNNKIIGVFHRTEG